MRTKNKVFSICLLGAAFFATFFSAGALLGASAAEEEGGAEQQPAQTENFAATQEGWDALPAGWTFGEDVMTSTANVFLGGGAMRDYYADTPSDYTVSATLHETASGNAAEIGLGIIPWAKDASNYIVVGVKWNVGSDTPFSVLTQRYINGTMYGAEGSASGAWNEDQLAATGLANLDRHEPITVTVEKKYNSATNMDAYTTTVSGTLTDGTEAELTLATDEFSMSVGFGGKIGLYSFNATTEVTNFTAEYAGAVEYDYEPYTWFTRSSFHVSAPSLYAVTFANNDADITMQAEDAGITRFWIPTSAKNVYEDITVSANFTLSAEGSYGMYLHYGSDTDNVRLEAGANGLKLIATQGGNEQIWTYTASLTLTEEHAIAATRKADGTVSVMLDGSAVSFTPAEGEAVASVLVEQLADLDVLNVGAFATGNTTLTIEGFIVDGSFHANDVREQDGWSVRGPRPDTWTVDAQDGVADISVAMEGGTSIWNTHAWTQTSYAPPEGYIVSAQVQVSAKDGAEIKYGLIPYINGGDVVYVWISQWTGAAAMICLNGTINGAAVFSGNGFMETAITIDMEAVNTLEVEILPDGSLNVYLNKSLSPTVATKIEGLAGKPVGSYGISAQNVDATFTDVQIGKERAYSVVNEVIINLPANFPTTGVVGQKVNLGVITASLAGDGIGTAPTPAITVTDPDNEPVELSGVIFTPEKAGEYTVTIIATDSWGNSATQTKTIVVTAADGDTGSDTDSGAEGGDAPAEGLPGWAIALIVVGGVVVVAAGVTAGVLISKKKAAADDEDSDAQ